MSDTTHNSAIPSSSLLILPLFPGQWITLLNKEFKEEIFGKQSPRNCYRNRGSEKQTKKGSNVSNLSNRLAYCSALCQSLSASHQNRHFSSLFSFSGNPFVFVPQPSKFHYFNFLGNWTDRNYSSLMKQFQVSHIWHIYDALLHLYPIQFGPFQACNLPSYCIWIWVYCVYKGQT